MSTAMIEKPDAAVPAYLQGEAEGLQDVSKFKSIPFLKVIQKAGAEELAKDFGLGSVIVQPDKELVAKFEKPFVAVPLFFWASWQKRKDANDPGKNPVVAQTYDETDEIAIKAKDAELWEEAYPDNPKMFYKYCECLNFILFLEDLKICAAQSYFIGSHKEGKRLCGYLARRGVSIYANRLSMATEKKVNPNNQEYYQLGFRAASPAFIGQQDVESYRELHHEITDEFQHRAIGIAPEATEE